MDFDVNRNSVDPINFLRVLALIMVFILHAWITNNDPKLQYSFHGWIFLLKTPAWAGVWIFFIISGYLGGKNFYNGKYTLDAKGLKRYYLSRIVRITPSYLFMCLFIGFFVYPGFYEKSPLVLLRILTFTYNGNPGVIGVGASWYVSTIAQMYLIAPLIFFLIRNANKRATRLFLLFVVASLGLCARLWMYKHSVPWEVYVYTFSLTNIDLFIAGMILSSLNKEREEINIDRTFCLINKIISLTFLIGLVIYNCYIYYLGDTNAYDMFIYQYILPTAYIFVVCFYLFSYDYRHIRKNKTISSNCIRQNPLRIIDSFSIISFEFYLWHSNVFDSIFKYIPYSTPAKTFLVRLVIGSILTLGISIIMYLILEKPIEQWRNNIRKANVNNEFLGLIDYVNFNIT